LTVISTLSWIWREFPFGQSALKVKIVSVNHNSLYVVKFYCNMFRLKTCCTKTLQHIRIVAINGYNPSVNLYHKGMSHLKVVCLKLSQRSVPGLLQIHLFRSDKTGERLTHRLAIISIIIKCFTQGHSLRLKCCNS
jgi:hypothetical protein